VQGNSRRPTAGGTWPDVPQTITPRLGPAVLGLQPFAHRIFYWQFYRKENNLKEDMAPEVCLLQQNP
jgi:hypothetical protein